MQANFFCRLPSARTSNRFQKLSPLKHEPTVVTVKPVTDHFLSSDRLPKPSVKSSLEDEKQFVSSSEKLTTPAFETLERLPDISFKSSAEDEIKSLSSSEKSFKTLPEAPSLDALISPSEHQDNDNLVDDDPPVARPRRPKRQNYIQTFTKPSKPPLWRIKEHFHCPWRVMAKDHEDTSSEWLQSIADFFLCKTRTSVQGSQVRAVSK